MKRFCVFSIRNSRILQANGRGQSHAWQPAQDDRDQDWDLGGRGRGPQAAAELPQQPGRVSLPVGSPRRRHPALLRRPRHQQRDGQGPLQVSHWVSAFASEIVYFTMIGEIWFPQIFQMTIPYLATCRAWKQLTVTRPLTSVLYCISASLIL